MTDSCFHCRLPLDVEKPWVCELAGQPRKFCCGGCMLAAETIFGSGLQRYYSHRPEDAEVKAPVASYATDLRTFDDPALLQSVSQMNADGSCEINLQVTNLHCTACVWLIEQHLQHQTGVASIKVNYHTRRAVLRWHANQTKLSKLLHAFAQIGYPAWPFDPLQAAQQARLERKGLLLRLAVAWLGMMQIMMLALPAYLYPDEIATQYAHLLRVASMLLTIPVVFYSGWPMLRGAWLALRQRHVGMDTPIALGLLAALLGSCWATIAQHGDVYFDSVAMFIALLLGARYLELRVRFANSHISEELARQLPPVAHRLRADGSLETVVVTQLQEGEWVLIKPGEWVPVDGPLESLQAEVTEALLTGESKPVRKSRGEWLLSGSHNSGQAVQIRVGKVGKQTRLGQIIALLERALEEKPPIAELADRIARYFVASLLLVALLVGLVWWWLDPSKVLPTVVAVLVVSCPCALSLATPMVLATAQHWLAKRGLLVTRGHAVEVLGKVTDVVLDKTGTLTQGQFELQELQTHHELHRPTPLAKTQNPPEPLGEFTAAQALQIAAALEAQNTHPIARVLRQAAKNQGAVELVATQLVYVQGQGVQGVVDGACYRLGNASFTGLVEVAEQEREGIGLVISSALQTRVYLALMQDVAASTSTGNELSASQAWGQAAADGKACQTLQTARPAMNKLLATFTLGDRAREGAALLVSKLQTQNLRVHLLSGDEQQVVSALAKQLGISSWSATQSPEQKRNFVMKLQKLGKVVLAAGDGMNDAPLLAQAQVSLAVHGSAAITQAGADISLNHGRIEELSQAIAAGRFANHLIQQNLWWALGYNVIAIPLAAMAWLEPWLAGLGMSLSSLLVVLNSWRLVRLV